MLVFVILAILTQAISQGGVFGVLGSSLTIVYGGLEFLNVAIGGFFALGAYLVYYLVTSISLNFFLASLFCILILGIVFFALERGIVRRYYSAANRGLVYLVVSIGLLSIINGLYDNVLNQTPRLLVTPYSSIFFHFEGFTLSLAWILSTGLQYALIIGFLYFMRYTKYGRGIRAMVQNRELAALMGTNTQRLSTATFMISSLMASAAGMLYALEFSFDPTVGTTFLLVALAMVFTGGPGSILGAAVIGVAFGAITSLSTFFLLQTASVYIIYALLIFTLIVRPEGLFRR